MAVSCSYNVTIQHRSTGWWFTRLWLMIYEFYARVWIYRWEVERAGQTKVLKSCCALGRDEFPMSPLSADPQTVL